MANVKLKNHPKELEDKLDGLATKLRITKEVLLSAIVLFAMDNQNEFDNSPENEIDIRKDLMIEEIPFPVGTKDKKKEILDWGKKFGRNQYNLQILFIIARFFEHNFELPNEYLGKATQLR